MQWRLTKHNITEKHKKDLNKQNVSQFRKHNKMYEKSVIFQETQNI